MYAMCAVDVWHIIRCLMCVVCIRMMCNILLGAACVWCPYTLMYAMFTVLMCDILLGASCVSCPHTFMYAMFTVLIRDV